MAKLPSAVDLQRRPAPSETPGVRAPEVSFAPVRAGAEAIEQGAQSIARGFNVLADRRLEGEGLEQQKRLLDFKLETEMALEERSRSMPPGGAAFARSWEAEYDKRAREFFKGVTPGMKDKIDLALVSHGTSLSERAQRYEFKEQDRRTDELLGESTRTLTGAIEASPERMGEFEAEGLSLIDAARIPPELRERRRKEFKEMAARTAIEARIGRAASRADVDSIRTDVAPGIDPKRPGIDARRSVGGDVTSIITGGTRTGKPGGWAASDPTWKGLGGFERAAAMALMEADGMNAEDARRALSAMINRSAAEGEELGTHVSRAIYQPTIEPAQQRRLAAVLASPAYKDLMEWAKKRAAGEVEDPVKGATHFLAHEGVMRALEAREPRKYRSWRSWTGYDESTGYKGVTVRDKSHAFLTPVGAPKAPGGRTSETEFAGGDPDDFAAPAPPPAYTGPYAALTLPQRRALMEMADTRLRALESEADKLISTFEGGVFSGHKPPEGYVEKLREKVGAVGSEVLTARLDAAIGTAGIVSELSTRPLAQVESFVREQEAKLPENATPVAREQIKKLQAFRDSMRETLDKDPLTWAHRIGRVKLDALNPGDVASLQRRYAQAAEVEATYGMPVAPFTEGDRTQLKAILEKGGAPMLTVLGALYKADPSRMQLALNDLKDKAPEAVHVGMMIAMGADPAAIQDIARFMELRKDEKAFKPLPTVVRERLATNAEAHTALAGLPMSVRAGAARAAEALYQIEAERSGNLDAYSPKIYQDAIQRALGQIKKDGVTYGGYTTDYSRGWNVWDSTVLVPTGVRTERFDDVMASLRESDFAASGMPRNAAGQPLTITEIRRAVPVAAEPGVYMLSTGKDVDGRPLYATGATGRPFAFNFNALAPVLRERMPDAFLGGVARPTGFVGGNPDATSPPSMDSAPAAAPRPAPSGADATPGWRTPTREGWGFR